MKISEVWSIFELEKRLENYSPATLKGYGIQAKLLMDALGDIDMEDIKYQDLKNYFLSASEAMKPSTLAHRIKVIRSLFRWAQDSEYIQANPCAKLKEPKQGQRIPRSMNQEDINLLRKACQSPLEQALLEFFYASGCRIGEVVPIKKEAINWQTRTVVVRGKGNKEREIYFTKRCATYLSSYLDSRTDTEPHLFVTERKYKPHAGGIPKPRQMSSYQMRVILKQLAIRAGIKSNIYPHRLRHTYACHLLDKGASLEAIQSLLGHAKLDTTRIYADLRGQKRKEMYEKYFK